MKIKRIADSDRCIVSTNNYEDDNCPVCNLMKKVEGENREPTKHEISIAFKKSVEINLTSDGMIEI